MASNGDILAGANAGLVYHLASGGTAFAILGAGVGAVLAAANVNVIAFDGNYATNNAVYVANSATAGIARWTVGTSTAWALLDNGAALLPTGMVGAPDGTLYVSDATAAAAAAGGIWRALTPTAFIVAGGISPVFESVSTPDLLTAAYTLQSLVYAPGSNVLYAIENSGGAALNRVRTYTDTLTGAPELTVGTVTAVLAGFSWTGLTGSTAYQLVCNTRADFRGTAQTIVQVGTDTTGLSTGLAGGVTYYARVRTSTAANAGAPVLSNWSNTVEFTCPLAAVGVPVAIRPLPSAQDITILPSFSWGAVVGAASYNILVADNPDFVSPITGTSPINAWTISEELEYSTTYYWKVWPISSTGAPAGTAVIGVFTTEVAPTPPVVVEETPPQITVTSPDITVTVPDIVIPDGAIVVPPAPEPDTPLYIWIIIIVGGILVIAVLTLILRTRRPL